MIITIDGPAGTGKSTIAKNIADHIGFEYFDTGAIYRVATWYLLHKKINLDDPSQISDALASFEYDIQTEKKNRKRYFVGKTEITDVIRSEEISSLVSKLSALGVVRKALLKKQKKWAKGKNVVVEGRDMGTVVFPKAELKVFLTASSRIRAERRYHQLKEQFPDQAESFDKEKILAEIKIRDQRDSSRSLSPLRCPKNAQLVDTTDFSIDEVTESILQLYRKLKNLSFKRYFSMKRGYAIVTMFCSVFFSIFYRLKVYGLEHFVEKRAMIAANHLSYLDPPAVAVSCPEEIYFLAKKELFAIPILGKLIRSANTLPVSGLAADLRTFREITNALRKERKVILFPEGTRSHDGKMLPLQSGVAFLAQMTDAPVIPMYIIGTGRIWPRKNKFPKLWGKVTCIFGSPIMPSMWQRYPKKEAIKWINERLVQSYQDLKQWEKDGATGTPP